MRGRNRPGQLPIRPGEPRQNPVALQQAPPSCRSSLGRLQPEVLLLGSNLLPSPSGQRQHPRLGPAAFGQSLVEDPLDHVAGRPNLRRRTPRPQPTKTRLLAPETGARQILKPMRTTSPKKRFTTQRTSQSNQKADFTQTPIRNPQSNQFPLDRKSVVSGKRVD